VEGVLQGELGYNTGEMSIRIDEGVIYDPEMDDNLPRKLSELGIKSDTFLTVIDSDDIEKDPRVNLELRVVERYVHLDLSSLTRQTRF
jgi:ubiquitin-like 1-activating enzyme E1 B